MTTSTTHKAGQFHLLPKKGTKCNVLSMTISLSVVLLQVQPHSKTVTVDNWICLPCDPVNAVMFKKLREKIDALLKVGYLVDATHGAAPVL